MSKIARPQLGCTLLASFIVMFLASCEDPPPPEPFRITFTAECEGEPIEGVEVRVQGLNRPDGTQEVYTTRSNGLIRVDIHGEAGISREAHAVCPDGYRSPEHPKLVTLRRIEGLTEQARVEGQVLPFECRPTHRMAALVVYTRTEGGGLPVLVEGEHVATTDENGVAHAVMPVEPNTSLRVHIDTTEHPDLRPQNPRRTYPIGDADRILQFNEPLQLENRRRCGGRGQRPCYRRPRPPSVMTFMRPTPI